MKVHPGRVHALRPAAGGLSAGPVVCWLSRDQRARDNWALLHARDLAADTRPLVTAFCLVPSFLGATLRQYDFLLRGLRETARRLDRRGIPLALLCGDPVREIPKFCSALGASALVTDFDPLRVKRAWTREISAAVSVPVHEVDAHNVVPARLASDKQEYAARTMRPKIHRLLAEFLEDFPELEPPAMPAPALAAPDWDAARAGLAVDESVAPLDTPPGEDAGRARLDSFLAESLTGYAGRHNDPNAGAVSGLSPYLHFGHLAPQRAALEAGRKGPGEDVAAFLEQLVVRRELSDNYCFYNPYYDSLQGTPAWAVRTLDAHRNDPRPHLYTREEFEAGRTHSLLWNAAQRQLLATGTMHGYMRMYWAKKILEWSPTPEEALATAIALNDRYQLDGRDPNGYVGALWSVGGLHDRPWKQRPVLGTVRYMNERGCRRKFDVDAYVARFPAPKDG